MIIRTQKDFNGVLLLNKPAGITSHDLVYKVRKALQIKKVGHAGTLDPLATGLMIILIGKATKLSQYLMGLDKSYRGTIYLGETTDSQDGEGKVIQKREIPKIDAETIQKAMDTFLGDQYQIPPMFSAIKKDGQPLYKKARKGEVIEREPRLIRVFNFHCQSWLSPYIQFEVNSSKGTYVRTLANDLGEKLHCGAHLSSLCRIMIGRFSLEKACSIEKLQVASESQVKEWLLSPHAITKESLVSY